ncbi:MAG TPA: DUF3341 domain-containing protein [Myxococcaceae bacterium]|nr:DUF3341 domain-containing protein [Myxococcaceae bacterium]
MSDWILGEFASEEKLLEAARELRAKGHAQVETYSPFPLRGASEAVGLRRSKIPALALFGGLSGATAAYLIQWFTNAVNWPINVGGRPPHSAPVFIPITFETGVLISAFFIFFGLWIILRLPQPYHPVFEVEAFRSASTDALWLSVESTNPSETEQLTNRLRGLGARQVSVVPEEP